MILEGLIRPDALPGTHLIEFRRQGAEDGAASDGSRGFPAEAELLLRMLAGLNGRPPRANGLARLGRATEVAAS